MTRYILRRLLLMVPVALLVTVGIFVIIRIAPGDPVLTYSGEDPDPATIATVAGETMTMFAGTSTAPQIKAGKLRALACFSDKRAASLPDVPTMKEAGYDVLFSLWVGLFAPKGTPETVVKKLREDSKQAVATDQFKNAIDNLGDVVAYLDQPDFAKFWDEDAKRVEAAVQAIGKV